jgi:hypothetical protein
MRRSLALLAFLLAALLAVPAAAAPPTVNPATAAVQLPQANWADAATVDGFSIQSTGTVEDDSGDQQAGVTLVAKVACHNSVAVTGPDEYHFGACLLAYSDGTWRGKFRITSYRYSTGLANTINVGWDQLDPHYRRIYDSYGLVAGTQVRGACLGCHSSVAYSLRDCDHPVAAQHEARTAYLKVRRSDGVLVTIGQWDSDERVGCGV